MKMTTVRTLVRFGAALALAGALFGTAACQDDDGAIENAGEKMQDAADDAGKAIDDAVD